jgi:hypothetical protein
MRSGGLRHLGVAMAPALGLALALVQHPTPLPDETPPPISVDLRTPSLADSLVIQLAPELAKLPAHSINGADAKLATARLRDALTGDMRRHFKLFLYVGKAARGPLAQRMYVFAKTETGGLHLLYNWAVSTGRERVETNAAGRKLPTFTPAGYFELDRTRFFPHYRSAQWGEPMPYAMFFNRVERGSKTGLAIHAATGKDVAALGARSSAGCVRLAPENAQRLFELIRKDYRGAVPDFAYDRRTQTTASNGMLQHDAGGKLVLSAGYQVLVLIEDQGEGRVAALL